MSLSFLLISLIDIVSPGAGVLAALTRGSRGRSALAAFALTAAATAVAAQEAIPADEPDKRALETVHFASLDAKTNLTAYLGRHPGDKPRPAVVLMHGCSGLLNAKGRIFPIFRAWMRALFAGGYDVLTVDSAASRGFGQTCSPGPNRITMWRDRPKDAYAALAYLQARPAVAAGRVALMGWSQGGGVTLLAINDKSIGRPPALKQDFVAAVSFYPDACSDRFQSKPWTAVEPQGWTTQIPLLVLFGAADTWTPLAPCEAFLNAAKARGNPIELKVYPAAVHAFDAPNLPRTELPAYRLRDGQAPVIGTGKEARADAFPRVLEFLKRHLD
jgi:dienelactone hydrolase